MNIINNGSNGIIFLIEHNGNYIKHEILKNKTQYFNKDLMKDINIEGIFELREYDHWFSADHNIEIIIGENEITYEADKKKIIFENSNEIWHKSNGELNDFETIKRTRYREIYEIIKNE